MSGELWQMARNGTTLLPGEARKLANAYDKLREERDALCARLAAAEQDAARYTFMRDNMVSVEYHIPFGEGSLACRVKTFHGREANGSLLDEAIDALATHTTPEDA